LLQKSLEEELSSEFDAISREKIGNTSVNNSILSELKPETVILSQEEIDKNTEMKNREVARKLAGENVRGWVSVLEEPLGDELNVLQEEEDIMMDSWGSDKEVKMCCLILSSVVFCCIVLYCIVFINYWLTG
jgi:hypothetical protein